MCFFKLGLKYSMHSLYWLANGCPLMVASVNTAYLFCASLMAASPTSIHFKVAVGCNVAGYCFFRKVLRLNLLASFTIGHVVHPLS